MHQPFFLRLARFPQPGYCLALIPLLITIILACGVSTRAPTPSGDPQAAKTSDSTHPPLVSADASGSRSVFAFSATSALASPPPAPTDLDATAGHAEVALTWNASTGASGYFSLCAARCSWETRFLFAARR